MPRAGRHVPAVSQPSVAPLEDQCQQWKNTPAQATDANVEKCCGETFAKPNRAVDVPEQRRSHRCHTTSTSHPAMVSMHNTSRFSLLMSRAWRHRGACAAGRGKQRAPTWSRVAEDHSPPVIVQKKTMFAFVSSIVSPKSPGSCSTRRACLPWDCPPTDSRPRQDADTCPACSWRTGPTERCRHNNQIDKPSGRDTMIP